MANDHQAAVAVAPITVGARAMPASAVSLDERREARFQAGVRRFHAIQGWLLALAATVLAASGQIEFAVSADITDLRRFLVPAILEIAAVFLLLGGYLRACDGDSPTLMWLLAAAVTGFAVWTNVEHGGARAGRIYAAATVLTFLLWLLKLRDHYRAARRTVGLVESPTARFRLIRWLVMPQLTRRAWLISVEYSLRDADQALAWARLWRDTFTDTRTDSGGPRWVRRRAARRAAALAVRHHLTDQRRVGLPDQSPTVPTGPECNGRRASTPAPNSPRGGDDSAPAVHVSRRRRRRTAPAGSAGQQEVGHPLVDAAPVAARTDGPDSDRASAGQAAATETGSAIRPLVEYQPVNAQDATMYFAWRAGLLTGSEPSGADLARAAGRADDTSGLGRRALRRYRRAGAEVVVAVG